MSEPQQYTLNQSVTIEPGPSEDSVNVWLGNVCLNFPSHLASSVFVPVGSVDNLKQQIEELLQSYGARFYADYEVDRVSHREKIEAEEAQGRMESRVRAEFADEVLELIQPEKHTNLLSIVRLKGKANE